MRTKCSYIDDYISDIRTGRVPASKEMHQTCDYIEQKLGEDDVFIDLPKIEKAIELIQRYFHMQLFPWETFVLALIHTAITPAPTRWCSRNFSS